MNSIDASGRSVDAFQLHDQLVAYAQTTDFTGKPPSFRQMLVGLRGLCGASSEFTEVSAGTRSLVVKFPEF